MSRWKKARSALPLRQASAGGTIRPMVTPEVRKRWLAAAVGREDGLESAREELGNLFMLMADLRSPTGCPWDREQSLASLRQYVREEADEVCEAIDAVLEYERELRAQAGLPPASPEPPGSEDKARTKDKGLSIAHHPHREDFDPAASAAGAPMPDALPEKQRAELENLYADLRKEMGDLLLQAFFLGDILHGMERGGVQDAAAAIVRKLIHRHPHVYSDTDAKDSAQVLKNWDKIKQAERRQGL